MEVRDATPLDSLDEWEDDLKERYPTKDHTFRDYKAEVRPTVKEFYRLNHTYQTRDFVLAKKREYCELTHGTKSVWEAMEFLNNLVDDSDPDTDATQIEHLMQTSEAIRADGHPRWFILAGLMHDLGKVLCLWGEPQWAVVGDTFATGCKYSDKVVFSEFFKDNSDYNNPLYQTENGIYEPGCGFDKVDLSFGHDEYIYHVTKDYMPEEALYMFRYHSFYPWHREGAYEHLASEKDKEMMKWVKEFNKYDLYTKTDKRPDVEALKPYYLDLIAEFFPDQIRW